MKHLLLTAQRFAFSIETSETFKRLLYCCLISALIILSSALFMGCITVKSAKLLAPERFGMEEVAPKMFVENTMPQSQREKLIKTIKLAQKRIYLYYGNVLSTPEFAVCSTQKCFQSLGGNTAKAKAFVASKILLSPRGITVPIIAHEWSHTELHARVEDFFGTSDIPRWFDEGMAVLVSNEPAHSEAVWAELYRQGISCPDLNELSFSNEDFRTSKKSNDASFNEEGYNVTYSCVGHEVRRWYRRAGRSGLAHFIETIRFNKPFEQAYIEAEGAYTTAER